MEVSQKGITICLGSSCFARGNNKVLEVVKEYIEQRGLNETLNFRGQLCRDNCNKGPMIEVNGQEYFEVTPSNVIDILNKHF